MMQDILNYFKGNTLPTEVFIDKYANGNEKPEDTLNRVASMFAKKEQYRLSNASIEREKYLSDLGQEHINKYKYSKYAINNLMIDLLSNFKYIIPGGSVLSTLGTDKLSSLSNCFVIASPEDSISGIMRTCNEQSQLMKYRGGVGFDISTLRPSKAIVNNAAKSSTGAASFMDLFSTVTNTIAQGGRRGALMLTMSINHPDSEEFILKKQDLTKVTGANCSIKLSNEFMDCVKNNKDFIQKYPLDLNIKGIEHFNNPYNKLVKFGNGYIRKVNALDLWNKIIHCSWNTAEPGIIFEDTHFDLSPDSVYTEYKSISTNPCFHPDTLISTEYGLKKIKDITIPMRVYSMDSTGKLVMAQGHASFISKKNVRTLKITLRNGNSIQITPEHKLYIHNKGWVEAKNIVLGDKIAHLCRSRRGAKYAGVHLTTSPNKQKDQVMEHKFVYGDYEFGYDVHHKDRNTYNNSINNLELLSHSNHSKITSLEDNPQTHQVKNNLGQFISGFNSKKGKKTIIDLPKELNTNLKNSSYNNVVKIEDGDLTDVYDMHVDNTHCLIANNMVAHNCGEIAMEAYDSCRLIHHNYTSYIINPYTKSARFDYETFAKNCYTGMILGDILIDLEVDAIDKILTKLQFDTKNNNIFEKNLWEKVKDTALASRRTGIGFTGLGDTFAMLGIKYGSKESINFTETISKIKEDFELKASIDLSILYGPFKGWNPNLEYPNGIGANSFYKNLENNFPDEVIRMNKFGRRNVSWSTAAPTGTISILAQTTSGIEPLFLPYYQRKKKILNSTDEADFVDKLGEKFNIFNIIHQPFVDWACKTHKGLTPGILKIMELSELDKLFVESPWYGSCANDLNYKERIKLQSIVQKYTTHSISSTINLSNDTKDSVIDNIFRESFELNLKGITVYRDGCRDGILTSINNQNKTNGFIETIAPKRPKELPTNLHIVSIKGIKFAILVGLYESKPYEVFAFELTDTNNIEECKGKIVKEKKRIYNFVSDKTNIQNLELSYDDNIEKKAFTLYTSMSLRHGVSIKYIVKTLNKVDENITSFAKALTRVLNKYVPKEILDEICPECSGKLIRENGCVHCSQCSYSKC